MAVADRGRRAAASASAFFAAAAASFCRLRAAAASFSSRIASAAAARSAAFACLRRGLCSLCGLFLGLRREVQVQVTVHGGNGSEPTWIVPKREPPADARLSSAAAACERVSCGGGGWCISGWRRRGPEGREGRLIRRRATYMLIALTSVSN